MNTYRYNLPEIAIRFQINANTVIDARNRGLLPAHIEHTMPYTVTYDDLLVAFPELITVDGKIDNFITTQIAITEYGADNEKIRAAIVDGSLPILSDDGIVTFSKRVFLKLFPVNETIVPKMAVQMDVFDDSVEMCTVEELCRRYVSPSRNTIRNAINNGDLESFESVNDRVVRLTDFVQLFSGAVLAPTSVDLDISKLVPLFTVSRYLSISSDGLRRAIRRGKIPSVGMNPTKIKIKDVLDAYPGMTVRPHMSVHFYDSMDDGVHRMPTKVNEPSTRIVAPESFSDKTESLPQQAVDDAYRATIKRLESTVAKQREQIEQLHSLLNESPEVDEPVKTKKGWFGWRK